MKYILATALLVRAIFCYAQVMDGPAVLPLTTPPTSYNSPNPAKTANGSNLQAVLNAAVPGDLIVVDKTSQLGKFVLPNGCSPTDPTLGITITSSETLPAGRLNPLVNPLLQYPTVSLHGSDSVTGGNCVEVIGFHFQNGGGSIVYNLVRNLGSGIVFKQDWFSGNGKDETNRGILLAGSNNVAVIQSYFNDIFCIALTGVCGDSQAIAGGLGDHQDGNYLIDDDYLEAAAEDVLFGGGEGTFTPTDITITNSTLTKNPCWNPYSSCYDGILRVVKNFFELKNAARVLVDHVQMSQTWAGFTQLGWAILLTPKNPGVNQCPTCRVNDVTIRNSTVDHAGGLAQIATVLTSAGYLAADGGRYSLHDIKADLQYKNCYGGCTNYLIQLGGAPFHDVQIDHVTVTTDGWYNVKYHGIFLIGGPTPAPLENVQITNNVLPWGWSLLYSTGGTTNCAYQVVFQSYSQALSNCFGANNVFTGNVFLSPGDGSGIAPISTLPVGNYVINSGYNPKMVTGIQ